MSRGEHCEAAALVVSVVADEPFFVSMDVFGAGDEIYYGVIRRYCVLDSHVGSVVLLCRARIIVQYGGADV